MKLKYNATPETADGTYNKSCAFSEKLFAREIAIVQINKSLNKLTANQIINASGTKLIVKRVEIVSAEKSFTSCILVSPND